MKDMKNISRNAITRDIQTFDKDTGNIYKTVVILSKRANQISTEEKQEIQAKYQELTAHVNTEALEEVFDNREVIEMIKYHETIPKPSILAVEEYLENDVFFRSPEEDSHA